MKVFLKIHIRNGIETVAVCDEELLNQVFKEGNLRIEISAQFFGGRLISLDEAKIDFVIGLFMVGAPDETKRMRFLF